MHESSPSLISGWLRFRLRWGWHWLVFLLLWAVLGIAAYLLWLTGIWLIDYAFYPPPDKPRSIVSPRVSPAPMAEPGAQLLSSDALSTTADMREHWDAREQAALANPPAAPASSVQPTSSPVPVPTEPTLTPAAGVLNDLAAPADAPADAPPTQAPPAEVPSALPPAAMTTPAPLPTLPIVDVPAPAPAPAPETYEPILGETSWTRANSPIILDRSVRLVGNATLIIEPGVEVRLLPDVSIHLEPGARLMALGQPAQGVTFVNHDFDRWNGIYGDTGSSIVLEHTEVRGGGANGTLLYSKEGTLTIRHARIIENGGITLAIDSQVDVAHTEIAANDIPFGAALNVHYNRGNAVTITSNRIGGNRLQNGASSVQVINFSPLEGVGLDIQGNLMRGGQNANLLVSTSGPIYGVIACNALIGDTLGLKLRTQTEQVPPPDLRITDNIINEHTPVIEPIYLDFGIGRGAASEVALDMSRNWWGEASGPYHPEKNPEGRGDSVGNNISYEPWLDTAPLCVPPQ